MPDDAVGNEAFAVIRDAMKADKVVGISKLVIGRREKVAEQTKRSGGMLARPSPIWLVIWKTFIASSCTTTLS
jgi:non-homologous end joining protein Ku